MKRSPNQQGFSLLILLVTIVVIAGLAFTGWYTWNKNQKDKSTDQTNKTTQTNKNQDKEQDEPSDPYEGWQTYSNPTYGISFRYPADWKVREEEGSTAEATSNYPISTRYAVILELKEEFKYNETISIEVLNQDLTEAATWYRGYYAQSSLNEVTEIHNELKGKQSVQYKVLNSGEQSRLYLFDVDNKTYAFSSSGSSQLDPDFWAKFDKVFESMQLFNHH